MSNYKIALCFLTYGNLSQPNLWARFVESKYNIYIHNKNEFTGIFKTSCIKNRVETEWGHISLVTATLNLFKTAFKDKENLYFILLSDKCIPLYDPCEIYNKVMSFDNNVISSCKLNVEERFNLLQYKTFFDKNEFMKQNQWMILNRNTVRFFIKHDYTHIFGKNFFSSDEHYFINIILKFKGPFKNKKITYTNWGEKSDSKKYKSPPISPKTYTILTNEMVKNILKSNSLFMRKVCSECNLPSYFDNFTFN